MPAVRAQISGRCRGQGIVWRSVFAMKTVNVVIAGLGGQGVIKASDILADAAFRAGFDVKKSELHGMSQRGGSVSSDVRYGKGILSPMIPEGEADALIVLDKDQAAVNWHMLRSGIIPIDPDRLADVKLPNRKSLNLAMLGLLSAELPDLPETAWHQAISSAFSGEAAAANSQAFQIGRERGLLKL